MKESVKVERLKQELNSVVEVVVKDFHEMDLAREKGFLFHRQVIKNASLTIRAVHREEYEEAKELLVQGGALLREAQETLKPYPNIYYSGFLADAEKEQAEAAITLAMVRQEPLPTPGELKIDSSNYIKGLAEVIGELRRHVLDLMRRDQFTRAEKILLIMDEFYYTLTTLDFPDAITRGLRRATDIARGCLERTRGELTTQQGLRRLEKKLSKAGFQESESVS